MQDTWLRHSAALCVSIRWALCVAFSVQTPPEACLSLSVVAWLRGVKSGVMLFTLGSGNEQYVHPFLGRNLLYRAIWLISQ